MMQVGSIRANTDNNILGTKYRKRVMVYICWYGILTKAGGSNRLWKGLKQSVDLDGKRLFVSTLSTPKERFEVVGMTGDDLLLIQ